MCSVHNIYTVFYTCTFGENNGVLYTYKIQIKKEKNQFLLKIMKYA